MMNKSGKMGSKCQVIISIFSRPLPMVPALTASARDGLLQQGFPRLQSHCWVSVTAGAGGALLHFRGGHRAVWVQLLWLAAFSAGHEHTRGRPNGIEPPAGGSSLVIVTVSDIIWATDKGRRVELGQLLPTQNQNMRHIVFSLRRLESQCFARPPRCNHEEAVFGAYFQ